MYINSKEMQNSSQLMFKDIQQNLNSNVELFPFQYIDNYQGSVVFFFPSQYIALSVRF